MRKEKTPLGPIFGLKIAARSRIDRHVAVFRLDSVLGRKEQGREKSTKTPLKTQNRQKDTANGKSKFIFVYLLYFKHKYGQNRPKSDTKPYNILNGLVLRNTNLYLPTARNVSLGCLWFYHALAALMPCGTCWSPHPLPAGNDTKFYLVDLTFLDQ